jgi:predicted  nucleic acid-binding Zn-ribbon protein
MKALENDMTQKQATIEKLSAEINADKEKLNQIKAEIDDSAQKIDLRSNQFKASYALVYNQIEEDVKKINSFI